MQVKIYRPAKGAMQSGRGRTHAWVMEAELETSRTPDPLMGWASSGDTNNQIKLKFDTLDKAIAHASKQGWGYTVLPDQDRVVRPRNYVDNFKFKPVQLRPAGTNDAATAAPKAKATKTTKSSKKA